MTLSNDELKLDLQTFEDAGGNISEAARQRGLPRMTFRDRLVEAERRGLGAWRHVGHRGEVGAPSYERRPLPPPGHVARYVVTAAQDRTVLHPGWINLKAYSDWLDGYDGDTCEFMVGVFSYAVDANGAKLVKRGTRNDVPVASDIEAYLVNGTVELAPGLVWAGELNILPTAKHPLSGLDTYHGRKSILVPHATVAMESVASMPTEGTKFAWSTGCITATNYMQRRAGIAAEQRHCYGGLIVEVDSAGNWYVRQLAIDGNGHVYDVGPRGMSSVRIANGEVLPGGVEAIAWGDIHAAEMDDWVRTLGWGPGGMLDTLRPRKQVMHDIFSMASQSPHAVNDFHRRYKQYVTGADSVEGEIRTTAMFLLDAHRPWCETYVVPSNHDRHLTRWLNDSDPRRDPVNAEYHMFLHSRLLESIRKGEPGFNIMEFALREASIPEDVKFIGKDTSLVLCRDVDGGIECALHGDMGEQGAKGSTKGLARLGRAVIKGHDHVAAIVERVYSVGACATRFSYHAGPSKHSISHCVVFENGRRQIITMWEGKWRA